MTATKKAPIKNLSLIRTKGDNKYVFYDCEIVERAHNRNGKVRVIKNGKNIFVSPRIVHRKSLVDKYGQTHEKAGQGKFIINDAITNIDDKLVVTGAQNVNPYLVDDLSYSTIVAAFHKLAGDSISSLQATVEHSGVNGEHLRWIGDRVVDGAILVSPWVTKEQLWNTALEINPRLQYSLRQSKSARDDAENHLSSREKFFQNIDVLRRSRRNFHIATGETDIGGGATPYSMPLEQCGFAIDMYFLTTGVDANGEETGEYFYRLAYGRSTTWSLYRREWVGLDSNASYAYLNK